MQDQVDNLELVIASGAGKPIFHMLFQYLNASGFDIYCDKDDFAKDAESPSLLSMDRCKPFSEESKIRLREMSAASAAFANTFFVSSMQCFDHGIISTRSDLDLFDRSSIQSHVEMTRSPTSRNETLISIFALAALKVRQTQPTNHDRCDGDDTLLDTFRLKSCTEYLTKTAMKILFMLFSVGLRDRLQNYPKADMSSMLHQSKVMVHRHVHGADAVERMELSAVESVLLSVQSLLAPCSSSSNELDPSLAFQVQWKGSSKKELYQLLLHMDDSFGVFHALLFNQTDQVLEASVMCEQMTKVELLRYEDSSAICNLASSIFKQLDHIRSQEEEKEKKQSGTGANGPANGNSGNRSDGDPSIPCWDTCSMSIYTPSSKFTTRIGVLCMQIRSFDDSGQSSTSKILILAAHQTEILQTIQNNKLLAGMWQRAGQRAGHNRENRKLSDSILPSLFREFIAHRRAQQSYMPNLLSMHGLAHLSFSCIWIQSSQIMIPIYYGGGETSWSWSQVFEKLQTLSSLMISEERDESDDELDSDEVIMDIIPLDDFRWLVTIPIVFLADPIQDPRHMSSSKMFDTNHYDFVSLSIFQLNVSESESSDPNGDKVGVKATSAAMDQQYSATVHHLIYPFLIKHKHVYQYTHAKQFYNVPAAGLYRSLTKLNILPVFD